MAAPLEVAVGLRGRRLDDIHRVGRRKGLFQALLQGVVESEPCFGAPEPVSTGATLRGPVMGCPPVGNGAQRHDLADAIWLAIQPC